MKGKGIPEESIEVGTINTITTCKRNFRGHATREADSFKLTQTFTVEPPDVNLVKRLAKEST